MHVQSTMRFFGSAHARFAFLAFAILSLLMPVLASAGTIQYVSDTLTTSAPNESANHRIEFKTTTQIPAGGYIRFTPEDGAFTIPAADFDIDNVELYVTTATSAPYTLRVASGTPSATEDGVSITPGTSGNIEITLNSVNPIPAGSFIRILLGTQTANATSTDVGITNPNATGTHEFFVETGGGTVSTAKGLVAIIDAVSVANISTRELIPPVRFNGSPSGTLSGTSIAVQISLQTNEFAKCRFSTASGTPFFLMGNEFGPVFTTVHVKNVPVVPNTTYTYYVRCIDDEGNYNTDDYLITFIIPPFPEGVPGPEGTNEGQGSGTGEGSGTADPGLGDPSGGDDTSGGTTGGGGGGGGGGGSGPSSGGGGGGGGFEGSNKPYQSGDARVIITGYAFPSSEVYVLVDGQQAERTIANTSGSFSVTIDAIARGVYTFGVYGIDRDGIRSSTFSTTFSVTGGRASTLSNINVMPSIKVTPNPVDPNSTVTFSGYAIPSATITIENQNDKTSASLKTFTTTSDIRGAWSYEMSTGGFQKGTYKVRAKAKQDSGASTNFSDYTYYGVGEVAQGPRTSDLNRDGKVNLIDFSILLYWWNTNGGNSNPPADINADGRVSLTDFSIMIFNWTG